MEFQEAKLSSCFRGDEYGVSSLVFDPQEELLWAATFGVSREGWWVGCYNDNVLHQCVYRVT